jgi:orotidine-5'-phosphate decarboxylase
MSLKLIVALDFDSRDAARALVAQLDPVQCGLKVGVELFTLLGPTFVSELVAQQFKVFLDLKFHDIPNTVARACQVAVDLGVWMLNVHAAGGFAMMQAARQAVGEHHTRPLLIAVTVLTSMGEADLASVGVAKPLHEHAKYLASLAKSADLDGVVCSAQEAQHIKTQCGSQFLTVTPGIRLLDATPDDQTRITHPADALRAGSDYLVVGRPITRAQDPQRVVSEILALCCHP